MRIKNKDEELIMMKKMAIALLCVALGSSLYARDGISESRTFIGLELGYVEVQGDTRFEPQFTGDYDVQFGVRLGAEKEEWRTTLIFDYYDSGTNDQSVQQGLMTIDYYVLGNEDMFKPYIGLNVGYGRYESIFIDESTYLYGGQVGFVVQIANKVNLDLNYRYSLTGGDLFDHVGGVIFSVDYLF